LASHVDDTLIRVNKRSDGGGSARRRRRRPRTRDARPPARTEQSVETLRDLLLNFKCDGVCQHESCALSVLRGFRNGVVYGAKIRAPHALVMTFLFRDGRSVAHTGRFRFPRAPVQAVRGVGRPGRVGALPGRSG
jgi:hypothetical protein